MGKKKMNNKSAVKHTNDWIVQTDADLANLEVAICKNKYNRAHGSSDSSLRSGGRKIKDGDTVLVKDTCCVYVLKDCKFILLYCALGDGDGDSNRGVSWVKAEICEDQFVGDETVGTCFTLLKLPAGRLIHTISGDISDLVTESIGKGENAKFDVVVKVGNKVIMSWFKIDGTRPIEALNAEVFIDSAVESDVEVFVTSVQ